MPSEEPRDLVQGLAGLVQFPDVELEVARSFWAHLQGHIDVAPGSVSDQPDGVVTVACFRADQVDPQAIISADVANSPGYLVAGDGHRRVTLLDRLVHAGVLLGYDVPLEVVLTGSPVVGDPGDRSARARRLAVSVSSAAAHCRSR